MNEDYSLTLAISTDEVVALIKYHTAESKRIARKFGKVAMQGNTFFQPSGRNLKALHDFAKIELDKHSKRAKGLLSLLR